MAIGMLEANNPLVPEAVDLFFSTALIAHMLAAAIVFVLMSFFAKRIRLSLAQLLALIIPFIGPLALVVVLCGQLRETSNRN